MKNQGRLYNYQYMTRQTKILYRSYIWVLLILIIISLFKNNGPLIFSIKYPPLVSPAPTDGGVSVVMAAEPTVSEPTVTEPTPTPTPKSQKQQIIEEIQSVFGREWVIAYGVAMCESGLNPKAFHENKRKDGTVWSTDFNIFQINDFYHSKKGNIHDWKENIRIAKQIRDASSWNAWVCFKNGGYKMHIN